MDADRFAPAHAIAAAGVTAPGRRPGVPTKYPPGASAGRRYGTGTGYAFVCGAALGYLADLVAGDPRRGHPVAAFGRAAAAAEHRLWRDDRGHGALYTALCVGGAVGAAALASRAARRTPAATAALAAAATWSVLGGTSLGREARTVGAALEAGDVDAARARLPHLCGRDPQALDAPAIARAVVESVAENTSDAVVGALVWGAVGGVPGLIGFRAVNTLDAMVGHRSPRHLRFGWASARLDDLAGWPGARLTALLAAVAGPDPRGARRVRRADGAAHPSPNAGPVEASFAGALGVRLGGALAYGGRVEHRPVLGAANRPVEVADIERAVRLSRRVGALALLVSLTGRLAYGAWRAPRTATHRGPFGRRPAGRPSRTPLRPAESVRPSTAAAGRRTPSPPVGSVPGPGPGSGPGRAATRRPLLGAGESGRTQTRAYAAVGVVGAALALRRTRPARRTWSGSGPVGVVERQRAAREGEA